MKNKQKSTIPSKVEKNVAIQTPKKEINPSLWLYASLIFSLLIYAKILANGFVNFDDDTGILANPLYQNFSISNIIEIFKNANLGMYAPISGVIYNLLFSIGNGNPMIFHAASLVLHLVNIYLVFKVLKIIFPQNSLLYGLVTLIFAVHPIQTESVAWAAAMSTPLYALFYLLAIQAYLKFKTNNNPVSYWVSILFFMVAVLSKSAAVTLPFVLILLDYLKDEKVGMKSLVNKIPFLIIALFFGILTFITRSNEGHSLVVNAVQYSILDRVLMIPQTIFFYFSKLLIPMGLCISYPFVKSDGSWSISYYLAPFLLVAVLYFCYKLYKNGRKAESFGLLFYLASISVMLPMITIGNFELRSDRYNYLALIGFFVFLFLTLQNLLKQSETIKWLGIGCASVFAISSFLRVDVWKSSYTLFTDVINKTENQAFAYYNRGLTLYQNQDHNKAIADFNKTLQIDPNFKEVYAKRAFSYFKLNNRNALQDFKTALDLEPENEDVMMNYTKACLTFGDLQKGVEVANKAIQQNAKNPELYYLRGLLLATGNVQNKAIEDYSMAIALNTNYADAYVNRGNIYANLQQYDNALTDFNAAIKANPKHSRAFSNRANLYSIKGNYNEAITDFTNAIQLDSKYANAYIGRARAYEKVGNLNAMQQDINYAKSLGVGK